MVAARRVSRTKKVATSTTEAEAILKKGKLRGADGAARGDSFVLSVRILSLSLPLIYLVGIVAYLVGILAVPQLSMIAKPPDCLANP